MQGVSTISAEHQASRAQVVGASEVAALFDLSPHLTRFELWHRKRGNLPNVDLSENKRVFWGQCLEPAIGNGIALETGWPLQKFPGHVLHPTVAGMGASPDFIVPEHPRGRGLVQVKNVDGLVFHREWEDERPPIHYQLQLQHELACTGFEWGALGVLVGGNDLRVFDYSRHSATIAKLEAEVAEFWRSIAADEEPRADFDRDVDAIRELFGFAAEGKVLDLSADERMAQICAEHEAASEAEKAAKRAKDAAKAEILTLIGDAEVAFARGYKVSAGMVAGSTVSFERAPYRSCRIYPLSSKQPKQKGEK